MEKRIGSIIIILLFLILPFCYLSNLIDPVIPIQLLGLSIITISILGFIFFSKTYKLSVNIAIVLFAGYVVTSIFSIYSSVNKIESINEVLKIFIYLVLLLSLYVFFQNSDYKFFISRVVTVFCLMIILIGFYQLNEILKNGVFNHQLSYKIKSVFANRNMFSEILLLTIPFVIYLLIKSKKLLWSIFAFLILSLNIFFIILLLVRTVWLGLFIASILTTSVYLIINRSAVLKKSYYRILMYVSGIALLIVISIFIYSKIDSSETLKKQLEWITNYNFGSTKERIELWNKSFNMIEDNLFTGVGIGNWKIIFPSYGLTGLRSETGELLFQRPHNDFIWVFSESGIFGFLFYLSFFVILLVSIFKSIILKRNDLFDYMLFFALLSYIIISFFSFPKERIIHSVFMIMTAALILSNGNSMAIMDRIKIKNFLKPTIISLIVINLFVIYFSSQRIFAEIHTKNAINFKKEKKYQDAINEIDMVKTSYYNIDPLSTPVKWYAGMAYLAINKTKEALVNFDDSYNANPNHLRTLNNLASCYFKEKNYKMAEKYYKQTLALSNNFQESIFNLSVVYLITKKYDLSYKYISEYKISNDKSKYIVLSTLPYLIDSFIFETPDTTITKIFKGIKFDENWMLNIHNKAVENKITVRSQLYMDAIYALDSIDHIITHKEAERLNKKYLN